MPAILPEPDLLLYTDGSGHLDGYCGYAALVKTADGLHRRMVMGAMTGSSTDRAEFTALIEGLRACQELWTTMAYKTLPGENRERGRARIRWFSDRANLVLSVKKVYSRSNCEDLWAAFEYYEAYFDIEARHVTAPFTDEDPQFADCDLHSSSLRMVIKAYEKNTPLAIDVQYKPKKNEKPKPADK